MNHQNQIAWKSLLFIIFISIAFIPPGHAHWEKKLPGSLPDEAFQAGSQKKQAVYFCRDIYTNFGIADPTHGCQLIYGSTVIKDDYEILVNPGYNLGWTTVRHKKIPIGAFDGGNTPLLGKRNLCKKIIYRKHYLGMVIEDQCHYRFKKKILKSSQYQILVNYWASSKIIPPDIKPGGKVPSGDLYICRVHYKGIHYPGTTSIGSRGCQFLNDYGQEITSEEYEIQLYIPHKWIRRKSKKLFNNAVLAGFNSKYYICRARILRNIYIGKTERNGRFCHVDIGGGHLRLKDYQLQIRMAR
ncbi:MAG: DUF3421 domain-containing protein [SAR324 cluster bacterium]|nr:DUF3421 domain-containing protein [SAR324 cluster bacterium]